MDAKIPSKSWHIVDPAQSVVDEFQQILDELVKTRPQDYALDRVEADMERGSWPFVDRITIHTFTVHSLTAHAIAEFEIGVCEGAMSEWSSLTVHLFGPDQRLSETFDTFFAQKR